MAEALTFRIGADTAAFRNQMGAALKSLAGLAATFASVKTVVDSFGSAIEMGGRLTDLSKRTGESAGNLAVLERAFENAGSSAEKVGPSINKMQKSIEDAAKGSAEAEDALASLGLSAHDLQGKLPIEQMDLIAERISAIPDPSRRAAAAMGIFGKSGGELLPILRDFDAEIEEAKAQLGSTPRILDENAKRLEAVGEGFKNVKSKTTEFSVGLLSVLLPAVEKSIEALTTLDAAGSGETLGQNLLGAFKAPLETIALLGETLIYQAKLFGNELVAAGDYAGQVIGNMFVNLWPSVGEYFYLSLKEASARVFAVVAESAASIIEAFSNIPGLDNLKNVVKEIRAEAMFANEEAESSAESQAAILRNAWDNAVASSDYVRADYLDAEGSAERIAGYGEIIANAGKEFSNELQASRVTMEEIVKSLNPIGTAFSAFLEAGGKKTTAGFVPMSLMGSYSEGGGSGGSGSPKSGKDKPDITGATYKHTNVYGAGRNQQSFQGGESAVDQGVSAYGTWGDGTPKTQDEFETGLYNMFEHPMPGADPDAQIEKGGGGGRGRPAQQDPVSSRLDKIITYLTTVLDKKIPQHVLS